jgi:hypothetical protein
VLTKVLLEKIFKTEHEKYVWSMSPTARLVLNDVLQYIIPDIDGAKAHRRLHHDPHLLQDEKESIVRLINDVFLKDRNLEWTSHKIQRSFRFWGDAEKIQYIETANKLINDIREMSPYCCMGFGSALSIVRDGTLIPHDDDLDILVAFPRERFPRFRAGKQAVAEFLREKGYDVRTAYAMHAHVKAGFGRKKFVDVFVGLIEDEKVSWYPGPRREIELSLVFPAKTMPLMGINCLVPKDHDHYLEKVYGSHWRTPIPRWRHHYKEEDFRDLLDPRFLKELNET